MGVDQLAHHSVLALGRALQTKEMNKTRVRVGVVVVGITKLKNNQMNNQTNTTWNTGANPFGLRKTMLDGNGLNRGV